jgi:hypothetical protein
MDSRLRGNDNNGRRNDNNGRGNDKVYKVKSARKM